MNILLIGLGQDRRVFLEQLDVKPGHKNVYIVGDHEVTIFTAWEQIRPEQFRLQTLDGHHGVIYLHNEHDKLTPILANKIPDKLLHQFDCNDMDRAADYMQTKLDELSRRAPYVYEEPLKLHVLESIYSKVSSLLFSPRPAITSRGEDDFTSSHTSGHCPPPMASR